MELQMVRNLSTVTLWLNGGVFRLFPNCLLDVYSLWALFWFLGDIALNKRDKNFCLHGAYILEVRKKGFKPCRLSWSLLVYRAKWWTLRGWGGRSGQREGEGDCWRMSKCLLESSGRNISGCENKWLNRLYIWKFGIKTGQDVNPNFLLGGRPMSINLPGRMRRIKN